MHPSLEPYVDPPSLINGRYILAGVLSGLTAMAIAVGIVSYVHHERQAERRRIVAEAQAKGRTRSLVKDLAFNAWPAWVAANPDRQCPEHLSELERYLADGALSDSSGGFMFHCDGVHFTVASPGTDGVFGSADDIRSDR